MRDPEFPPAEGSGSWGPVAGIVLANVVLLWGIVARDWQVFVLLPLFWAENAVAGLFHALRIAGQAEHDRPFARISWGETIFFCFHYGFFLLVHALFVFGIALDMFGHRLGGNAAALFGDWLRWTWPDLRFPLAVFAGTQAFDFVLNFGRSSAFQSADTWDLRKGPYGRLAVLQVGLMVGSIVAGFFARPAAMLVCLVLCKMGFDVVAYLSLHRLLPARPQQRLE